MTKDEAVETIKDAPVGAAISWDVVGEAGGMTHRDHTKPRKNGSINGYWVLRCGCTDNIYVEAS